MKNTKSRSKSPINHKSRSNINDQSFVSGNHQKTNREAEQISKEESDLRNLFEHLHNLKRDIEGKFSSKNYVECILLSNKCLGLTKKFYQEDHIFVIDLLFTLSECYINISNLEEAIYNLEKILEVTVANKSQLSTANYRFKCYMLIGATSINIGDYTKSLKVYDQVEKEVSQIFQEPELNLKVASINLNVGICYIYLNNFSIAERYLRKAHKSIDGILGNEIIQRLTSDINENLGLVYDNTGKSKEAINYYKKSLKVKFSSYGDKHNEVLDLQYKISSAYLNLKMFKEAEEIMIAVTDVITNHKIASGGSSEVIDSYYRYGVYFYTTGIILLKQLKRDQAKEYLKKAEVLWKDILASDDPSIASLNSLMKICEKK